MEVKTWFVGGVVEPSERTVDHKEYTANCLITSEYVDDKIKVSTDISEPTSESDTAVFIKEVKKATNQMIDIEMDYFYKD